MARRKNRNNAKTNQETVGVTGDSTVQDASSADSVVVNTNENGEATNGTTQQGDESDVQNTQKIPQNGVREVETLDVTDNDIAKAADEDRTEEEVQYADESNPNQKGRTTAAGGAEYDQDGNLRTDGYSYGVSADDTRGVNDDSFKENVGEAPEEDGEDKFANKRVFVAQKAQTDVVNQDDPNVEVTEKDVAKLEKTLSDEKNGVVARVVSSTAGYYKIKFFRNNKPFVTYKSRGAELDLSEAKAFLAAALKEDAGEA